MNIVSTSKIVLLQFLTMTHDKGTRAAGQEALSWQLIPTYISGPWRKNIQGKIDWPIHQAHSFTVAPPAPGQLYRLYRRCLGHVEVQYASRWHTHVPTGWHGAARSGRPARGSYVSEQVAAADQCWPSLGLLEGGHALNMARGCQVAPRHSTMACAVALHVLARPPPTRTRHLR